MAPEAEAERSHSGFEQCSLGDSRVPMGELAEPPLRMPKGRLVTKKGSQ